MGVTALPALLLTLVVAMAALAWSAHQTQAAAALAMGGVATKRVRSTQYVD